ncbi:MAG: L-threonylcarbamoyladenylate synthase [Verrucomicrobiota bacterium]
MPAVRTRIYRPTPVNLRRLAAKLARGGLVAVPSETVYGLAADALNPGACEAIFTAKGRPANDPLIVHIAHRRQLATLTTDFPDEARALADAFWPGPLTLVLNKTPAVPDIVTAGLPSVAVRMPANPLFRQLIRLSGCPLAAPSANPFGYISPTTAQHVKAGLDGRIAAILDGGPCPVGVESTILDLRHPRKPVLLRPGGISREALAEVLGRPVSFQARQLGQDIAAEAPGLLWRHYSPRTPLTLHASLSDADWRQFPADEAILLQCKPRERLTAPERERCHWLSHAGAPAEVARNLFDALRRLDDGRWNRVHVELAPTKKGLGPAINDRLTRAAAKS